MSLVYTLRVGSRGRVQGVRTPPPTHPEMTCGFVIQLVFCKKKQKLWFIGVEVVVHPLLKEFLDPSLTVNLKDPF